MRIAAPLSLLAFALSIPLSAQAPSPRKAPLPSPSPMASGPVTWKTLNGSETFFPPCPLAMQVRQGLGSHTLKVNRDGSQTDAFAARLHMTLLDLRPEKIALKMVQATVSVSGLNGRDHILGLYGGDDRPYQITRTLTVRLDGNEREGNADLRLPGFTATTWVQLKSVTFEDGEVMTFTAPTPCGARPDPLMLISPR
jgi:hypothetical protein